MVAAALQALIRVTQSCPSLCDPADCSPPGSSAHGILQARILECVEISFSRRSSRPRNQTQVSCIAGRFFTSEPPGKRHLCPWNFLGKNTGMGCHALLQEIFPTQGLNPYLFHLLHCRLNIYPEALRKLITIANIVINNDKLS